MGMRPGGTCIWGDDEQKLGVQGGTARNGIERGGPNVQRGDALAQTIGWRMPYMNDRQQTVNLIDEVGKDYSVYGLLRGKRWRFWLDHILGYLRAPLFGVVEPWRELGPVVKVFFSC